MRGTIIKREGKKGVFYDIVYDLGRDPLTGKRKQKWQRGFKTKKEAEKALAQAVAEVERGTYLDPARMTVAEYLREWHRLREGRVSETTWHRYGELIEHWLIPLLGGALLAKLQPLQIEQAYETMKKSARKDGKRGSISPTTVHHAHCVLHKALADAVKKRLIPYNPTDAVEPPRRERKKPRTFTEEEVNRLLAATEGTRLHAPIALAAYTGMRLGEVLGLKWEDVDLEAGIITVQEAMKRPRPGRLVREQPKTAKSRRRIEIGPDTIAVLKRQKKLQAEWRLKAGGAWQDTGLVCTWEDGSPMNPNGFSSAFCRLAARLGIGGGMHALRHTHATLMLKAGVPLKVAQERLGHASIVMTGDIYSHVLPGMQREAARIVEETLKLRR